METSGNSLLTILFYLVVFSIIPATYLAYRKYRQKKSLQGYIKDIDNNDIITIKDKCSDFTGIIKILNSFDLPEIVPDRLIEILSRGRIKNVEITFVRKVENKYILCNIKSQIDEKNELIITLLCEIRIDENIIKVYTENSDFTLAEKNIVKEFLYETQSLLNAS
ncbi:MAG: hypothetical protein H8E98_01490 [Bacteroidetes bacterium]|nr:hypothetical protein [Bacteroidota bacterium]